MLNLLTSLLSGLNRPSGVSPSLTSDLPTIGSRVSASVWLTVQRQTLPATLINKLSNVLQALDGRRGRDQAASVEDTLRVGCYRREIVGGVTLEQDRQVGGTQRIVQVWYSVD